MIKGGIGFFDSGIGGLTVLDACLSACKQYPIYYYGDNLHAPYGNKGKEELCSYVFSAFDLFAELDVIAVVVACNTVTALLIEELRAKYPFPIIGLEPAVFAAAKSGGQVFSLTTLATYDSVRYHSLLRRVEKCYPQSSIQPIACTKLAAAVEGIANGGAVNLEQHLPKGTPDSVVLGCTHYIYLKDEISDFYGCKTYDGNADAVKRLKELLKDRDARPLCPKNVRCKPLLTTFPFNKVLFQKNGPKKSKFRVKKAAHFCEIKNHLRLYFLGSGRLLNAKFYEQMFIFKKKG